MIINMFSYSYQPLNILFCEVHAQASPPIFWASLMFLGCLMFAYSFVGVLYTFCICIQTQDISLSTTISPYISNLDVQGVIPPFRVKI